MRKQEEHHDLPRALCAHSPGLYLAAVALTLFPSGASAYRGDRTIGGGSRWYRGGYRLQGNYGGRAIIEQDDPTTLCIISDKPSSTSAWVMVWNNQPAPDWEWIQAGCVVFDHTLNDAYPTKVFAGWIGQDGAHGIDAILDAPTVTWLDFCIYWNRSLTDCVCYTADFINPQGYRTWISIVDRMRFDKPRIDAFTETNYTYNRMRGGSSDPPMFSGTWRSTTEICARWGLQPLRPEQQVCGGHLPKRVLDLRRQAVGKEEYTVRRLSRLLAGTVALAVSMALVLVAYTVLAGAGNESVGSPSRSQEEWAECQHHPHLHHRARPAQDRRGGGHPNGWREQAGRCAAQRAQGAAWASHTYP